MVTGEVSTGFSWGNVRERDHLEDPGIDGMVILRWFIKKWYLGVWTGSVCVRTGAGGEHLLMR